MQSFNANGDFLTPYQFREMCKRVIMSHETLKERQVLRLDVSKLGVNADTFFNYLVSNVPGGNGIMKLEASGKFFREMDGNLLKTIIVTGPTEKMRSMPIIGSVVVTIPSTIPGWLISLFHTRSCRFA